MTHSSKTAVISVLIGLGSGAALTWGSMRHEPTSVAATEVARAPECDQSAVASPVSLSAEDKASLRAVIREEIRAAAPEAPTAAPADAPPAEPDIPGLIEKLTPEQRTHYESGRAMVDSGVNSGHWTETDRDKLRETLREMPGELQMSLLSPLIVAMNQGEVQFEGADFPF